MIIKSFTAGPFDANNYLIMDETTKEAALIDCSEYKQEIIDTIKELGAKVKFILLTHGHFDHVLGVNEMQKALGVKARIKKEDLILTENINEATRMFQMNHEEVPEISETIEDWQEFELGTHSIKAIPTPGHTEGGLCFLLDDKTLFSGDTLFYESFGRTDLYGGNIKKLVDSIKNNLFMLNDDIVVYPGHSISTTIKHEKASNEILKL